MDIKFLPSFDGSAYRRAKEKPKSSKPPTAPNVKTTSLRVNIDRVDSNNEFPPIQEHLFTPVKTVDLTSHPESLINQREYTALQPSLKTGNQRREIAINKANINNKEFTPEIDASKDKDGRIEPIISILAPISSPLAELPNNTSSFLKEVASCAISTCSESNGPNANSIAALAPVCALKQAQECNYALSDVSQRISNETTPESILSGLSHIRHETPEEISQQNYQERISANNTGLTGRPTGIDRRFTPEKSNNTLAEQKALEIIGEEVIDGVKHFAIAGESALASEQDLEPEVINMWAKKVNILSKVHGSKAKGEKRSLDPISSAHPKRPRRAPADEVRDNIEYTASPVEKDSKKSQQPAVTNPPITSVNLTS